MLGRAGDHQAEGDAYKQHQNEQQDDPGLRAYGSFHGSSPGFCKIRQKS
jgi:hypothetical protein